MKTGTTKIKPSTLQKRLLATMGAIDEIVAERDYAVEMAERLRKWEERPHGRKKGTLPSPRIQFEHVPSTDGWHTSWCMYWIVLPLDEYDIRREYDEKKPFDEWFIPVGETKSTGGRDEPPIYNGEVHSPFRDGAHAHFDCKALGVDLPIYAVCGDVATLLEKPAPQESTPSA